MRSSYRVVLDTNVAVSAALLRRSTPRRAFDEAIDHGTLLNSAATLAELSEVLGRPRFNRYVSEDTRHEFLEMLVREAELIEVTERLTVCRDPKDDKFLELAISGGATHIISGDEDLLTLHPFRGISVLSPQDFVTQQASQV